jgi:hypothetical protein
MNLFLSHIIFTVHSVLYNSFYFNQHMHYNAAIRRSPQNTVQQHGTTARYNNTVQQHGTTTRYNSTVQQHGTTARYNSTV